VALFDGFETGDAEVNGQTIHYRKGGSGPPVLLLHGYPQTHVLWHKIAPTLAETHTVVAADLRGYGASSKPETDDRHEPYSFRNMAADQVALMKSLGHEKFSVVGHDRGGRVGHRMALDHPDEVERLMVLDIIPTLDLYESTNMAVATGYYHWFFLIQPYDFPERLIGADPEYYLTSRTLRSPQPGVFTEEAVAEYLRCFRNPKTIHASCEDYRAAATIDLEHDRADLGRRIACPLMVLWGANGFVGKTYDVLDIWRQRAKKVSGEGLPCGHFIPEEAPDAVLAALRTFLAN